MCSGSAGSDLRRHPPPAASTDCKPFFSMSGASELGALPPAGWACSEEGEIKNGEPQCKDDDAFALFKHSQSLEEGDVWRMKVLAG